MKARPTLSRYSANATRHSPRTCGQSALARLGSSSLPFCFLFFLSLSGLAFLAA